MRTLAAIGLLVVALCQVIYALQLHSVAIIPEYSSSQQATIKVIMFHAALSLLFALASILVARGWLRLAALIPVTLAGITAWEIYSDWLHIFP